VEALSGHWTATGAFDFFSQTTRLLTHDFAIGPVPNDFDKTLYRIMGRAAAQAGAETGADNYLMNKLPQGLSDDSKADIFHERIHHLQSLMYPFFQCRFLIALELIRTAIVSQINKPPLIFTWNRFAEIDDADTLLSNKTFYDLDYRLINKSMIHNVKPINPNDFRSIGVLEFNSLRVAESGAAKLGFGIVLLDEDKNPSDPIEINGLHLIETFAQINQLLLQAQSLPKTINLNSDLQRTYYAIWEYWRRIQGNRYTSDESLAISLLAVIDLALMGDPMVNHLSDPMQREEMTSVSLRFSRLCRQASSLETPTLDLE
jgi:hypothetical protein